MTHLLTRATGEMQAGLILVATEVRVFMEGAAKDTDILGLKALLDQLSASCSEVLHRRHKAREAKKVLAEGEDV